MMKTTLLALAAAALAASASAAPPAPGQETSIAFASTQGVRDFRPDGTKGIYLQDIRGKWYRGTFTGTCQDMPWANAIAVETKGTPNLDKWGAIRLRNEVCQLNSLVSVDGPPKSAKKAKAKEG